MSLGSHPRRRLGFSAAAFVLGGALTLTAGLGGQTETIVINQPHLGRSVHGAVLDATNRPLPEAIVYLQNQITKAIHTVVTDNQGNYSFHDLDTNATYTVYATWKGQHSPTRTDSQYDTTTDLRLDLTIPVA